MLLFDQIPALKNYLRDSRHEGKTIGFVPTMGALHAGHLSLIERAVKENDLVICSIFVNALQFNNAQDYEKYPRLFEKDINLLAKYPNLYLFLPEHRTMYSETPTLKMDFGQLEQVMEGAHRPGHFNGVGIVVSKLFHIVQPHRAYFGQKDLQQCRVIECMVRDLSFDLECIICPTVREDDGLAMSSRNLRLTPEQRKHAVLLPQALFLARDLIQKEQKDFSVVRQRITDFFENTPLKLEYFEIVHSENLQPVQTIAETSRIALCIAAYLGEIRLIDNILLPE
ncbi:MAG: pantoate--beta-alanine ligase [Bacteroidetes bacterium]|nr:MAG: pantoate--beta-alanine ligase [Bacteroidota bacterium]